MMKLDISKENLHKSALTLLKRLIARPSFSKDEEHTADIIGNFLIEAGIPIYRLYNNIWSVNEHFDPEKPIIFLNSHHDTVKPNPQYTNDPFTAIEEDGKLFGLGSNDAGGCLVSLVLTFCYFYEKENLPFNIVLGAVAEEEISGHHGVEALFLNTKFQTLDGRIQFDNWKNWQGIVGEPTQLELAVAEKGLMVLDVEEIGKAGHAARNEGDNAIYHAVDDIAWFKDYHFEHTSEYLGDVKMSVTSINTENKAHNVVPAICTFIVDIRITDEYTHEQILETIESNIKGKATPRSFRLRSSRIDKDNPLVKAGIALGKTPFGSPTSSDKALTPFQALKVGPGDSARSHSANEFIFIEEIYNGVDFYIDLIEKWEH